MQEARAAILRAQCFFASLAYPATKFELVTHAETSDRTLLHEDTEHAIDALVAEGVILYQKGRFVFPGSESLIEEHRQREALFPRKIRRAKRFTKLLSYLAGVKGVYVCNTLALAHTTEESDIDLFIVCKQHTAWQTRFFATVFLMVLRWRVETAKHDPVCLTFFVDERALDLSSLSIEQDVYLQHWFLSLLPLLDDGIGVELWNQNAKLRTRYPLAQPWMLFAGQKNNMPMFRLPTFRFIESLSRRLSEWKFAKEIRSQLGQGTAVVANDHILKFHVDDRRAEFRDRYRQLCKRYEV